MSASKQEKERKSKLQNFKEQAKEKAKQANTPKEYLVPLTEWQSTEILDLRGDLLEALEQQAVLTYQELRDAQIRLNNAQTEFNKLGQIMQVIMQTNIKSGKIKLKYSWNNGEDATADDIKEYETKIAEVQKKQQEQYELIQAQENAKKTGLVGPDGTPVGTAQNLEEEDTELDKKAEKEEVELKDEL